jgi:hypothetical protein
MVIEVKKDFMRFFTAEKAYIIIGNRKIIVCFTLAKIRNKIHMPIYNEHNKIEYYLNNFGKSLNSFYLSFIQVVINYQIYQTSQYQQNRY